MIKKLASRFFNFHFDDQKSAIRNPQSAIIVGALLLALCFPVHAQQPAKIPRIGLLPFSGDPSTPGPLVEAFRQGLRDLGYIEGKNINVEYRWPLGRLDHIPPLIAELVQLNVNVLVVGPQPGINAAKKSTKIIPIVMISSIDPVAAGHVESLARPGGNVTGLALLTRDLSAKRVELLKEIVPRMTRLGILWDQQGPGPVTLSWCAMRTISSWASNIGWRQSDAYRSLKSDLGSSAWSCTRRRLA